jgi:hypothetical protein
VGCVDGTVGCDRSKWAGVADEVLVGGGRLQKSFPQNFATDKAVRSVWVC